METKQEQVVKKKSKLPIIIILLVLIFLCCAVSAAAGGGYYLWKKHKDKENADKQSTEQSQTDEDTDNETDNDTDIVVHMQPTASEVVAAFSEVLSYRLSGETSVGDSEQAFTTVEYQAPDREYVSLEESMGVSEEIVIGDSIYFRAQGGEWTIATEATLTGFHISFSEDMLGGIVATGTLEGEELGYWKYSLVNSEDSTQTLDLFVDEFTLLPSELVIYGGVSETGHYYFYDFNSSDIQIEAPI